MIRENIYWGELHNHNEIGYGAGSIQRSYAIAESLLDIYACVIHGWWPDPPGNDPKVVDYHVNAFDSVSKTYPSVVRKANEAYKPGEFVSLVGYEWHSSAWGDYQIIFPGDRGELYRAESLRDLQEFARREHALLIPHHCAYRLGWRGTNWQSLKTDVSPVAEAFSEHGNSLEGESISPMLNHSMGGVCHKQTIMEQLKAGKRIGFTAGTDNHYGHPASYGEGITGIFASALTRESVFEALRARHTFAATGDRIELRVSSGDAIMGDCLPAAAPRKIEVEVSPLAPLEFVSVIKNGETVHMWPGVTADSVDPGSSHLVRVEWGWDQMDTPYLTQWQISFRSLDGRIVRAIPCMGGGAGSSECVSRVNRSEDGSFQVESFTSRANARPISGVVLEIMGETDCRIDVEAETLTEKDKGGFACVARMSDLQESDLWGAVLPRFSSPRIRVGRAFSKAVLGFRSEWKDARPSASDFYLIKAQQMNGQIAWSSPIWFSDE